MISPEVQTGALVEELHQHAPDKLSILRHTHPTAGAILKRGKILGGDGAETGEVPALLDLAADAAAVARHRSREMRDRLQRRIRRALRLRLLSAGLGALASAGVIGMLSIAQEAAALISAVLAFIGSALTLLAQYADDAATSKAGSPTTRRDRLAEIAADLALLEGKLAVARIAVPDREASTALASQANGLVAELRRIEFEADL